MFRYDVVHDASVPVPAAEDDRSTPTSTRPQRAFFNSKDGTRVPMFITSKKGLKKDGSNPTMLYGYGGFDIATLPSFRPDVPGVAGARRRLGDGEHARRERVRRGVARGAG